MLEPVAPDRVMLALNHNQLRAWSNRGFALVRGHTKYIWSEFNGDQYFDLDTDPLEQHNLWAALPDSRRAWVEQAVRSQPALARLRDK